MGTIGKDLMPRPLSLSIATWFPAAIMLALANLAGCGRVEWNDDLEYPDRISPIVVLEKHPDQAPPGFPLPGRPSVVPEWLTSRGVTMLDPAAMAEKPWSIAWKGALRDELVRHFATPGKPQICADDVPALAAQAAELGLTAAKLSEGSKLYRRLCVQCHGLAGDGVGASSAWLSPSPRDLRTGDFKFISSAEHKLASGFQPLKARPRHEDIMRSLRSGLEGTSMPSFAILGEESLDAIAAYVIHLSIRGELEFTILNGALRQDRDTLQAVAKAPDQEELIRYKKLLSTTLEWEDPEADVDDFVAKQSSPSIKAYAEKYLDRVLREYSAANKNPLQVPPYPYPENQPVPAASIAAGHTLFKAQCVNCHADYGRQSDLRFEVWGSVVRPANLTQSQYKGGRRPVDLYYRIARGIPPCAMPKANLGENDPGRAGWDLVNFLQALPHPDQLPAEVRTQVYGAASSKAGARP